MLERFETFTSAIFQISQSWNKIAADEMALYDLKGAYATYLVTLFQNRDGVTSVGLCEMCNKDKAEISRAISVMEEKGLAIRENITVNSYRAIIKLTDKGIDAANKVIERVKVAVAEGGKGLSESEREIFYSALEKIALNLKKISKEGLPK